MKTKLSRLLFQEKLLRASHFTLNKLSSSLSLHGGLFDFTPDCFTIITTNLSDFFQTKIPIENGKKNSFIVEIKKISEFLGFLSSTQVELEVKEKTLLISSGKTIGSFSLMSPVDFPKIPLFEGRKYRINQSFFEKTLPLVLFSVASDETRPILTGVNFSVVNGVKYIAATDGFRLSLYTESEKEQFPEITISSRILTNIIHSKTKTEQIQMICSEKEKVILFSQGSDNLYSRIIDGDFPPYEKVIPTGYTTQVIVPREEFLRNIKLSSVFARDFSHIILLDIRNDGIMIRPRIKEDTGTLIHQEADVQGKEQKIAFNYKFVLDVLSAVKSEKIIFEMTQSNVPSVFRIPKEDNFLHVIMPVRMDDEESTD